MTGLTRLRAFGPAAVLAVCVALALPAAGLAAAEGGTPTYTKESEQAFQAQLGKGEIASAVFNKPVRSLRLTLKDGRHVIYTYPKKGSTKLEETLQAKGIAFEQLKGTGKHKHKSPKHTRRYIAIAVVVVLLIAGGAFLLLRRRRLGSD
jgi:hypothetical protein